MKERLLEELAEQNHLYISDLRIGRNRGAILRELAGMDLQAYGLDELNYCLSYILQKAVQFDTMEELERAIDDPETC